MKRLDVQYVLLLRMLLSRASHAVCPIQLCKSQPHDGAAAAVALQRVFVSVLAGHYRSCSSTGCPDSSTRCSQQ